MVKLNIIDNKFVACPLNEELPTIEVTDEQFNLIMDGKLVWKNGQLTDNTQTLEKQNRIAELKQSLENTDHQAIKHSEGLISEEDYAPMKAQRQAWRDEINELEKQLKA